MIMIIMIMIILKILSFDIAPVPHKHAQRRIRITSFNKKKSR